jgi:fatty acid/phospholipid biosynthesis enzyme
MVGSGEEGVSGNMRIATWESIIAKFTDAAKTRIKRSVLRELRQMSHWNYRIIHHPDSEGTPLFGLHEVFYDDAGGESWTESAIVVADSLEEMTEIITKMIPDAVKKDVIDRSKPVEEAKDECSGSTT